MRIVDADVLRRELINGHDLIGAKYVDLAPDIDAVEVVRCKDCKHWDKTWKNDWAKDYHYCIMVDGVRKDDFYCADAERRNDGTD